MAFCPNCGGQINPSAKFCAACGSKTGESQESASAQQPQPQQPQPQQPQGQYQQQPQPQQPQNQPPQYQPPQGQQPQPQPPQPQQPQPQQPQNQYQQQGFQPGAYQGAEKDAADNKIMAILAYLAILVLVPILSGKDSRFARYHANQGLVLVIAEVAYGIVMAILNVVFLSISWYLGAIMGTVLGLIWLVFLLLAILGIVNAAGGKMKPLPIIGGITILKQ